MYKIVNRAQTDRTLLIEHPNRKGQQFKLVDTPSRRRRRPTCTGSRSPVAAKKDGRVHGDRGAGRRRRASALTNNADDQIRYFINLNEAPGS